MFELTTLDTSEPPHPASGPEAISHTKNTIEKSITTHFSQPFSRPIIFSGFSSLAEKLSEQYDITYVDKDQKSSLKTQKVVQGDVLEFIYFNASPCLVISSTTSANWHYAFQLDKLTKAVERNKYKLVLIEFYDADAIKVSRSIKADLTPDCTEWQLDGVTEKNAAYGHSVADIKGCSVNENNEIKTKLGVYNKQNLLAYFKRQLPMYDVEVHSTLIPFDPSFTIAIKEKKVHY
ncbi:hypothetical protein DI392_14730 [Vibrio albus]|uniref:Uncharacterized protein n=1 Tax=Vibrio albus TaxID=2200953 RepID=A0A2U3B7C3_9VIBR|nr:hypothetical protein [Vibrio albus]PWI32662.1 hypothetical protein DI392_14730 [Vibrio albus]